MLRRTFATHGSPRMIVSDNASSFTSKEFSRFCDLKALSMLDVHHITPPWMDWLSVQYKPLRVGLKKVTGDLETRLLRVLAQYRLFPQSTMGQSSAMVLMGRQPRSRLDLVFPDLSTQVITKIDYAKRTTDKNRVERMFHIGDTVSVMNFQGRPKWLAEVLEEQFGPLTLSVVRAWSIMEKTCRSYSREYSNRTCSERLRRIQATSGESGTNSYKALNICCTASCTLQR